MTVQSQRSAIKAGRPKSIEKRENILLAATDLFLEHGFASTSMDLVANQAGVSKQTVYSHFSNKDALFSAAIDFKCREYQLDAEHITMDAPAKDVLTDIGLHYVSLIQDPRVIAIYQVIIAEARSNPHVAQLFYEAGPHARLNLLCDYLLASDAFNLNKQQARFWAMAFFNLLKGEFHTRGLLGLTYKRSKKEQHRDVELVVESLLGLIGDQTAC